MDIEASRELILFLAARPAGTTPVELDRECAAIEDELRSAPHRDFVLVSRWAVTADKMMRYLVELQPTVIHFSGHGAGDGDASPGARDVVEQHRGGICLEGEHGGSHLVTAEMLMNIIECSAPSARLVVLNACYSEAQARAACAVVDCVIGASGAISDDAARAFASGLYRGLAHRCSIGNAIRMGRAAILARSLPGADLLCCTTRGGIDPEHLTLTGGGAIKATWPARFAAIRRLMRRASESVDADPLSAAKRAQQTIEHVADYMYEREFGPVDRGESIDRKLARLLAKLVVPRTIAAHIASVHSHGSSVIDVVAMGVDPDPALLRPCLASLALVVAWFFRDYLKQPTLEVDGAPAALVVAEPAPPLDATPVNSTTGTVRNTEVWAGAGIGELIPVWRTTPMWSTLRIDAPDAIPDVLPADQLQLVFRIEARNRYYIGRTQCRSNGVQNDFAIPESWLSISRDQGCIVAQEDGVVLTNTSNYPSVYVCHEVLPPRGVRRLCHGDTVRLGTCFGSFFDGRYYPAAPAAAVDWRTGLLSRMGLVAEISGCLANGEQRVLFALRCPEHPVRAPEDTSSRDPEWLAITAAMAIHRALPDVPVGRVGETVVVILGSEAMVAGAGSAAERALGDRFVCGFVALTGTAEQAIPRLEACLSALSRLTIAGHAPGGPCDLSRYALTPTPLDGFPVAARPLFAIGGGAVLLSLEDLDRLDLLIPEAVSVLELELAEMLGARMGPRDVVSFVGRGQMAFATPGDIERFAQEVCVAWHGRGPVRARRFEIDRSLSAHLLAISDLDGLSSRVAALARGDAVLGADGFPAPVALAARLLNETRDGIERARRMVGLVRSAWQLLAFVLDGSARGSDAAAPSRDDGAPSAWPAPWRALARDAARRLVGQPARIAELADVAIALDADPSLQEAVAVVVEVATVLDAPAPDLAVVECRLPRLERAVREILHALGPLRGWTLIAIMHCEHVAAFGTDQRIEYIDFTGPSTRGSHQHVTVTGFRGLGRFLYLVRWHEGLAIALEPHVRCAHHASSGHNELFLTDAPIAEPGPHRYRAVAGSLEVVLPVTDKQLGRSSGAPR